MWLTDLELWSWPWTFNVKFWSSCIPGMGWPIDIEGTGCEWIVYWTHYVTLPWPPPWLWTQIFKVEVSQWPYLQNCRTDWRGTKRMQVGYDARPTMQPWSLTSFLDFKGQILKYMYVVVFQVRMDRLIWNNRDMNRQDDDYPVWPYPCAWPWISKVKFRKWLYPRNHFRYYFGAWQIFLSLICYIRWWWAPPRWRQKRRRFYVRHQFW